jgi:hypothetical protein
MPERGRDGQAGTFMSMVSPKNVLFSLPTICDRVPEADPVLVSEHLFEMHEDDWRQIEFVDPL